MLSPQKTVFFDIKNVVLHFDHKKMLHQIAAFCGTDIAFVTELLNTTDLQEKYEKGEIDSRTVFHYLPSNIQNTKTFGAWAEAISNVFELNEPMTSLLKELKQQGIKLFILSNICEVHFSYAYTHFPILHLFNDLILSYLTGLKKPDAKAYQHALEVAKTNAESSFFIEGIEEFAEKARLLGLDCESYLHIDLLRSQLRKRGFLS